jgi:hypothetical protein
MIEWIFTKTIDALFSFCINACVTGLALPLVRRGWRWQRRLRATRR